MKNLILPLTASVVLLISCSKDDDSNNTTTPKLYKTIESYERFERVNNKNIKTLIAETTNLTYEKNGYISTITSEIKKTYKLDSKDSISIKKNELENSKLIYNSKNQLIQINSTNEIENYYKYDTNGNLIEAKEDGSIFNYEYKNGILVKSTRTIKLTNSEIKKYTTLYKYNNGVIKEINENDKSYELYYFDNKKNPFYLLMPEAFIKSIPTFTSKHNVIKTEIFNAKNEKDSDNSSSFKYNSDGYPTEKISTTGREEYKRVTKTTYFYK